MALQMDMIKDIRKYETAVLGPFTARQLVCILIALAYSVPIGFALPFMWNINFLVAAALALPCVLCGYIKIDGAYFEVIALRLIYKKILTPAKRKYKRVNEYKAVLKKTDGTAQEKKKIAYSRKPEYKIYR